MDHDALKSLHTALIDAREGYEKATAETEDSTLAALFGDMIALHTSAHNDIHERLLGVGEKPDESGSFMGTVHRTVIGVRSAITGIDMSTLDSFADGEERITEKYSDAINEERDPRLAEMLRMHESALRDMIGRMKQMARAAEAAEKA